MTAFATGCVMGIVMTIGVRFLLRKLSYQSRIGWKVDEYARDREARTKWHSR